MQSATNLDNSERGRRSYLNTEQLQLLNEEISNMNDDDQAGSIAKLNRLVYTCERKTKKTKGFLSNIDGHNNNDTQQATEKKTAASGKSISDEEMLITGEKLDSIKSGESIFKLFTFEPSKHLSNIEKCAAFWTEVMSNTDLKPVKCPLLKTSKEQLPEADTEACTKQSHESNLSEDKKMSQSSDLSASNLSWKDVLLELQKRNLDKVAAAASYTKCKMCNHQLNAIPEFDSLLDDDFNDIVELNKWVPKKKIEIEREKAELEKKNTEKDKKSDLIESTLQEDATKRVAIREEECSIQSFTISENIENIVEEVLDSIDYPAESKLPEVPKMDYEYLIDTYVNKDEWMVDADVSPDKRVQYEKTLDQHLKGLIENSVDKAINNLVKTTTGPDQVAVSTAESPIHLKTSASDQIIKPSIQASTARVPFICDCGHSDCKCNVHSDEQIEATESVSLQSETNTEEFICNIEACECAEATTENIVTVSTSSQFPEMVEAPEMKGSYCVVCGLDSCTCQKVVESDVETFTGLAHRIIQFALSDGFAEDAQSSADAKALIEQLYKKYSRPETNIKDEINKCNTEMNEVHAALDPTQSEPHQSYSKSILSKQSTTVLSGQQVMLEILTSEDNLRGKDKDKKYKTPTYSTKSK